MTKERDPKRKKDLDYERQHFSPGKSDKAFRRQWPKTKKSAERAARHAVSRTLATTSIDTTDQIENRIAAVKRKSVSKWDIFNLREYLAVKRRRRVERIGRKRRRPESMNSTAWSSMTGGLRLNRED